MPYGIAFFAILLLVSGLRGTEDDLGALLKGDFIGKDTFLPWMAAIIIIGAIGYIPALKKPTDAFLALLLLVLVLANRGVFSQLSSAIDSTTSATTVGVNTSENADPFASNASAPGSGSSTASTATASTGSSGSTTSTLVNVGVGMASGAAMGAVAGPYGAAIGAVAGGIAGGLGVKL